ncbi:piggyBac transposable element-derived protein 4 [Trichonephila clavipes]|nr:piggyBac transposable element-derived protein 4 [Trichonephila clavipes]
MKVKAKKGNSVKLKPKVVVFYNNSMGGVDRSDQCLSYYPVARNQQRKYCKKIFRHLLNQIVWNSFVIFKKNGGILNHIGFRMNLIERLIEEGSDSSSRNLVESDCSKKQKTSRKCVVCNLKINDNGKRIRKETRFQCKDCNVGLCVQCRVSKNITL